MTRIQLPTHEKVFTTRKGTTITTLNDEYAAEQLPWGMLKIFPYFLDTDEGEEEIHESPYGGSVVLDRTALDVLHKLTVPKIDPGLLADWEMCDRKHSS